MKILRITRVSHVMNKLRMAFIIKVNPSTSNILFITICYKNKMLFSLLLYFLGNDQRHRLSRPPCSEYVYQTSTSVYNTYLTVLSSKSEQVNNFPFFFGRKSVEIISRNLAQVSTKMKKEDVMIISRN